MYFKGGNGKKGIFPIECRLPFKSSNNEYLLKTQIIFHELFKSKFINKYWTVSFKPLQSSTTERSLELKINIPVLTNNKRLKIGGLNLVRRRTRLSRS